MTGGQLSRRDGLSRARNAGERRGPCSRAGGWLAVRLAGCCGSACSGGSCTGTAGHARPYPCQPARTLCGWMEGVSAAVLSGDGPETKTCGAVSLCKHIFR